MTGVQAETVPVTRAAMATHPDILDVWVVGGLSGLGSGQEAERLALGACNKAMGGGCSSGGYWEEGHAALVRSKDGGMTYATGATADDAIRAAHQKCDNSFGLSCQILGVFSATDKRHAPDLRSARKVFAAGAAADGLPDPMRLWIITGASSMEAAQTGAQAACQLANPGRTCTVHISGANGVIQTFVTESGRGAAVFETTRQRAAAAINHVCANQISAKCAMTTAYSAAQSKSWVHDYRTGKPTR